MAAGEKRTRRLEAGIDSECCHSLTASGAADTIATFRLTIHYGYLDLLKWPALHRGLLAPIPRISHVVQIELG